MLFFTYILRSKKSDRFYIGSTNNLERRVNEHNAGQTHSTRSGKPWELVYSKEFDSKIEATQFEMKIKKMKSRKFILNLISSAT
ncbi:MAG: GIY-YIG nuclease family protein [Melioribacteraceae bacterium]|nr:GIY-YIG nuclease family protein [Melioribacteraceae bacterium]